MSSAKSWGTSGLGRGDGKREGPEVSLGRQVALWLGDARRVMRPEKGGWLGPSRRALQAAEGAHPTCNGDYWSHDSRKAEMLPNLIYS